MSILKNTKPYVFIIESLDAEDEKNKRREGRILSEMLRLSGKESQYFYIRTKKEIEWALKLFMESNYRYLHISCHANQSVMATTIDTIKLESLGSIMGPYLNGKRLFISACSMASPTLANSISPDSGCLSIPGPKTDIGFHDAAIFWAAFYYKMFRIEKKSMKSKDLIKTAQELSNLFGVSLNCYYHKGKTSTKCEIIPVSF